MLRSYCLSSLSLSRTRVRVLGTLWRILPKIVQPVAFEPPTKHAAQGIVRASCPPLELVYASHRARLIPFFQPAHADLLPLSLAV